MVAAAINTCTVIPCMCLYPIHLFSGKRLHQALNGFSFAVSFPRNLFYIVYHMTPRLRAKKDVLLLLLLYIACELVHQLYVVYSVNIRGPHGRLAYTLLNVQPFENKDYCYCYYYHYYYY